MISPRPLAANPTRVTTHLAVSSAPSGTRSRGAAALGAALGAIVALTAPAQARTVFTNTDEVRACLPLVGGDTLVGTGGGLVRVDAAGDVRQVWTASDGLPGTRVDALMADGDRVWIGTDAGIAQLTAGIEHAVATKPVRDIARFRGRIFLATWEGGVIELGGDALAMHGGSQALRVRASALAVASGTLWAGTAAGLYRMRDGRLDHVDGPREVSSLVADGAKLWIGAPYGVWLADGGAPQHLGGGEVRHLAIVDGTVLAAGTEGLASVVHGRVVAASGAPRGFVQAIGAAHGAVCTGGLDGLWLRASKAAATTTTTTTTTTATTTTTTSTTAATTTTATTTTATGTWLHAPHASGLPSSDISAIAADGPRLWVGTFDQGLATYDPDRGWRRITAPGLDARINAIVVEPRPSGAHIWVGTAEGIAVIDSSGAIVTRLGRTDGLPSRSILSLARLADGRIVAGTSAGAAFVDGGAVHRVGPRIPGDKGIGNVWAIAETASTLWLGTTTGLYRGPKVGWTTKDGADDEATLLEQPGPQPATPGPQTEAPGPLSRGRWQRLSVATGHLHDDWVTALAVRSDVVWAGTYNGGISRIDGDIATQLGGGWINPSGLTWDGDRLLASTMEGLVIGDGQAATWTTTPNLPGRDTTGTVRIGHTLWVATRRGLTAID